MSVMPQFKRRDIKGPTRKFLLIGPKMSLVLQAHDHMSVMTEHQLCPCPMLNTGEKIEELDMVYAFKEHLAQERR